MRKRWRWIVTGFLLVALAAFVLWPRPDRVTWMNYLRIRNGMNRAEVEAVLGQPGDYASGPLYADTQYSDEVPPPWWWADFRTGADHWAGDAGQISIQFGPDGVTRKHFIHAQPVKRNAVEKLQYRFGRLWRRWFP